MKTTFIHGIVSGILAGLAGIAFNIVYSEALLVDFSKVLKPIGVLTASLLACLLASVGYHFFAKWVRYKTDVWFNIIFLLLSFISMVGVFSARLPLDIETPELFPGLVLPMHLLPVLFWLATKPLFNGYEKAI